MKPTSVFMAISTTLVGVATFSVTRNSSVRMENVQMSIPLFVEASTQGTNNPGVRVRGARGQRCVQHEMLKGKKAFSVITAVEVSVVPKQDRNAKHHTLTVAP